MSQSDLAISIRGLSKSYAIAHGGLKKPSFREVCMDRLRHPFRRPETETFWALRDVSFDVKKGEVVGIIGRNGAGKSTLLKILSRITEPTGGEIDVYGRIGSLLEVGTGFHPELTGRENIYLNGSILGMTRGEITRQFDAIVDFAEIEKFLDTPVKRYSSGMYVRLAFAVAAHLNPEIMIVDEVLAVGDTGFQKKCLGKMGEVARLGRTILFVSHNLGAVRALCTCATQLSGGQLVTSGAVTDVIATYLTRQLINTGQWRRTQSYPAESGIYFDCAEVVDGRGEVTGHVSSSEPFTIQFSVTATHSFQEAQLAVMVTNQEGICVFTTCNTDPSAGFVPISAGQHQFRVEISGNLLMPGFHSLKLVAHKPNDRVLDVLDDQLTVCVERTDGHVDACREQRIGMVCPLLAWSSTKMTATRPEKIEDYALQNL